MNEVRNANSNEVGNPNMNEENGSGSSSVLQLDLEENTQKA